MMIPKNIDRCPGALSTLRRFLAAALIALPFAACDTSELLDVDAPSLIPAEGLEQPEQIGLLVNGAVADFECALGSFVLVTGILSDELADGQLGSAGWPLDRRDLTSNGAYGVNGCTANQTPGAYVPTSTARWSADNALKRLEELTPEQVADRDSLIATAAVFAGYSYVQLGTGFCSAAVDQGPELTPEQVLAIAEERFTTAIDAAQRAGASSILNLALLGRARTRLYLGRGAEAVADAEQIPEGFAYYATMSADNGRRNNRVYAANNRFGYYTVEPSARNAPHDGAPDPRMTAVDNARRSADGTPLWEQTKYDGLDAPIPVARWAEAQLIIAEVEGGQTAVDVINALHAEAGLPAFASTDPDEIRSHVIEERRRELFLEGHRQYDYVRFDLPFDPAVGEPFPIKGGFYGDTRCMPLPDVERFNNPSIGG